MNDADLVGLVALGGAIFIVVLSMVLAHRRDAARMISIVRPWGVPDALRNRARDEMVMYPAPAGWADRDTLPMPFKAAQPPPFRPRPREMERSAIIYSIDYVPYDSKGRRPEARINVGVRMQS